jgi:hypothetical protein
VEGMLLVARHRFDGEGQRKQRMVTYRSTGSDDAAAFDREGREQGGKLMAPGSLQVNGKSYGSRRGRGRGDWKP